MALYRFFKKELPEVPSPYGPLSSSLSPATIKDANVAVKQCADRAATKPRGPYVSYHGLDCDDHPYLALLSISIEHESTSGRVKWAMGCGLKRHGDPAIACAYAHAKETFENLNFEILFQGGFPIFAKICTNENFPLYGSI